jgi:hypothetical protein
MTNMTLAIPEDLHLIMKKHLHIKWSEIVRQALWNEANKLEMMDKILATSKLTEEDAERIGKAIKKEIAKRHGLR